jgi:ABC-type transport system involved in cytochrome bd biosynthesis fused ATPase/permease subunit
MRRTAPIVLAGLLLHLLVPVTAVLGRPVGWLGLQLISWACVVAALVVRRVERRQQERLTSEAERLQRTLATLAAAPAGRDEVEALVDGLDRLLVSFKIDHD